VTDSLQRLYQSVLAARDRDPGLSRTSKLFRDGVQKMAKKLVEESIEVGLDAVQANREAVILESADLLYHLVVIWAECGVAPRDAFAEIERREKLYGIAEKLPKAVNAHPRRLSSLASRRKVLS
jgi:phosphoribosyl-ATP pyrophosphohydrolase